MQRYSRLSELKGYHEFAAPDVYLLPALVPSAVRQLYLANVALQLETGTQAEQKSALASLHEDIQIWRRVLTGDGALISKMVAVYNLQGNFMTLGDLIADRNFDVGAHSSAIRAALDSVKEEDWKIGRAWAYEFRLSVSILEQARARRGFRSLETDAEDSAWQRRLRDEIAMPLLKVEATKNLFAKLAAQRRLMADAEPGQFLAARDAYRRWSDDDFELGFNYVYNRVGKVRVLLAWDPHDDNSLRAYDGAGLSAWFFWATS
jgi:hypothetical protein